MYEFSKKVLTKVSFDKTLFRKELLKSKKWLKGEESLLLKAWCLTTFGHIYKETILDVFDMV